MVSGKDRNSESPADMFFRQGIGSKEPSDREIESETVRHSARQSLDETLCRHATAFHSALLPSNRSCRDAGLQNSQCAQSHRQHSGTVLHVRVMQDIRFRKTAVFRC